MAPRPKIILSQPFFDLLEEAGIIPSKDSDTRVRRVVIDAEIGAPVRIYFDTFGDERLLSIGPPALAKITRDVDEDNE